MRGSGFLGMKDQPLTLEELRNQLSVLAETQEPNTLTDVLEVELDCGFNLRKINFINQREERLDEEITKLRDNVDNIGNFNKPADDFLVFVQDHDR